MPINSLLKSPFVLAVIVIAGIGGVLGVVSLYTHQETPKSASAGPVKEKDIKWTEVAGSDGYKYAIGITKVEVRTKPASNTDAAIPEGKARLITHFALQGRTAGSVRKSPKFVIGLPKSSSWQYISPEVGEKLHYQPSSMGCTSIYGSPEGKPDYCWNDADEKMENDSSMEVGILLTNGKTVNGTLSTGQTQVSGDLKASEVMFGLRDWGKDGGVLVIPWQ